MGPLLSTTSSLAFSTSLNMSDSSATSTRVQQLITRSRPTNTPRRIHRALCLLSEPTGNNIISRVLHREAGVRETTSHFSRAWWNECSIVVVPTVHAVGVVFCLAISAVPEDTLPTTPMELRETAACSIHSTGSSDALPNSFTYHVNFDDANTNPLIRPPPIEERRTAIVIHFNAAMADGGELPAHPLAEVYMTGLIVCGGQE